MIIGNGDIAGALRRLHTQSNGITFFAAGVSDSRCGDSREFNREYSLLSEQDRTRHLVYFSSLSIYHSISDYANHKYQMERVVRDRFENYTIVRLGNIAWGINQNTVINFLKDKILNNQPYYIDVVYRFIVSMESFLTHMQQLMVEKPKEMNIHGERILVSEIVERIKDGRL